jgi:hypothetical protein
MRYQLEEVEITIKVIDACDRRLNIMSSMPLGAISLKNQACALPRSILLVTPTMPQVFFTLCPEEGLKSRTHHMSYRSFLGFADRLRMIEEIDKPSWKKLGF